MSTEWIPYYDLKAVTPWAPAGIERMSQVTSGSCNFPSRGTAHKNSDNDLGLGLRVEG